MRNKVLFMGYFFVLVGIIFIAFENIFYQYVDKDGFLHESLFLPLGVLSFVLGLILIFVIKLKDKK